jgi:hypothetical protein
MLREAVIIYCDDQTKQIYTTGEITSYWELRKVLYIVTTVILRMVLTICTEAIQHVHHV